MLSSGHFVHETFAYENGLVKNYCYMNYQRNYGSHIENLICVLVHSNRKSEVSV